MRVLERFSLSSNPQRSVGSTDTREGESKLKARPLELSNINIPRNDLRPQNGAHMNKSPSFPSLSSMCPLVCFFAGKASAGVLSYSRAIVLIGRRSTRPPTSPSDFASYQVSVKQNRMKASFLGRFVDSHSSLLRYDTSVCKRRLNLPPRTETPKHTRRDVSLDSFVLSFVCSYLLNMNVFMR